MSNLIPNYKIGVISLSQSHTPELYFYYVDEVFKEVKAQSPKVDVKRIVLENKESVSESEKKCIESFDVLIADPGLFVNKEIFDCLDHVKWIQILTAGVEAVTNHFSGKPPPKFILSRNIGYFDIQMAQYVMGHIISRERLFQEFKTLQKQRTWKFLHCRPLHELTIGIVGYGSVGQKITEFALGFEFKVVALVKKNKEIDDEQKDAIYTTDLVQVLQSSDYIVSILPHISHTNGFFDGDVLEHCKQKKPVFINIGRGNVVKDTTIIKALDEGWLSHAVLDVFEEEPLPAESPLWNRDDVTITPHVSGSQFTPSTFVKRVLEKFHKLCDGTLTEVVDWSKGY